MLDTKNFLRKFIFLLLMSLSVVSCNTTKKQNNDILPASQLYDEGLELLKQQDYKKAGEKFSQIFLQNPSHQITPKAELLNAYSLYKSHEYDDAIDVLDLFIKLHPRHEYVGYAFYLKAMSDYIQLSPVNLDQSRAIYTKQSIEAVVNLFSNTDYAKDAKQKLALVNDHLAGHDMLVGLYYLKKQNIAPAITRFQTVINKYGTTLHVPEALYRIIASNFMLGLPDEAERYFEVLKYNYPENIWTERAETMRKEQISTDK